MQALKDGAEIGLFRRGRVGALLIVLALAASLAVPVFLGGEDALRATLNLSASGYLALLGAILVSWIARTWKLRMLLRGMGVDLGFAHVFEISLATDFGFLATPAGLGGYAASLYYVRCAGAPTSVAAAFTAADQGLDLMFFAIAVPLAGFAFFGAALPPKLVVTALTVMALLGVVALAMVLARSNLRGGSFLAGVLLRRWPKLARLQKAFTDFCARMQAQLQMLAAAGPLFVCTVFALTALQWITRYGILWLALCLLGYRLSFGLLLALQALVLHVAQWSGVPAGGGGAELGLSAALTNWVPATTLATALLLWRLVTLYFALAAGALAIVRLSRREGAPQALSSSSATP